MIRKSFDCYNSDELLNFAVGYSAPTETKIREDLKLSLSEGAISLDAGTWVDFYRIQSWSVLLCVEEVGLGRSTKSMEGLSSKVVNSLETGERGIPKLKNLGSVSRPLLSSTTLSLRNPPPMASSSPPPEEKTVPAVESLIIVHNVAKRHNVGTLARSATAFGVSEMVLVGRRDFNSFGAHGSVSHLRFRHFPSLSLAAAYLKVDRGCDICGVEIADGALSITAHPFKRSTAFLLGNEGTGLSEKECEICDFFVYIPQYGGGTASLNVTVAASIVLHHFGTWAGFPERSREGNKFILADKPIKQARRNYCAESIESVIEERKCRRENACADIFEDTATNGSEARNLLEAMFAD
ncbi:uncharacterized protein [Typha latifolia]|uniref:uncharacterized protein isoform X1 n=1 Tax=Typha latifolia TaxID=4733 RepID=UPI003C2DE68F